MYLLILKVFMVITLCCGSGQVFSSMPVNDYRTLDWNKKEYSAQAPMPFGSINLVAKLDSRGGIESMTLYTDMGPVNLPTNAVKKLSNIGEPEIAFNPGNKSAGKNIIVSIEYGEPRPVNLGDVPNCGDPCISYERPIASFVVDRNLKVISIEGLSSK